MKFHKSINFKLTFWYGLVTFISGMIILFVVNFIYVRFVNQTLEDVLPGPIRQRFLTLEHDNRGNYRIRDLLKEIRENDAKQIQKISLFVITGNLLIGITGGYILAKQMLRPIKRINKEISEIEAKNLHRKIPQSGTNDEIDELIGNFNTMTDRLQKSFDVQGEFVANASHELKTPMAVLMTNIETALMNKNIPRDTKEYLETSLGTVHNMNVLLEDLLLLSSLEKYKKSFESVNYLRLIKNLTKNLDSIANKKDIEVKITTPEEKILIKANPTLLNRAISNVVENAIKYSQEQSIIEIQIESNARELITKVIDNGPGIDKKYHKLIFERFFRIDDSRSRKTGGSGLGLAITKEIINLHNGEIKIQENKPMGTIFVITLPKTD
ncbi:MAG TPA: HAMP domain-containing sensor histidine kinase [Candidatus Dojkabacteria bacterium]|nr:HAMP domain-containing sensor histidine kinase [Candidatus Dojkabacteria bacterium]HRP51120.1 HAMP domain-containing sensor histidine kinase [Candidatus Dojkabacteria bacterium]